MRRALGARWQYSLTAAEGFFSCFAGSGSDHKGGSCSEGMPQGLPERREWGMPGVGCCGRHAWDHVPLHFQVVPGEEMGPGPAGCSIKCALPAFRSSK